MAKYSPLAKFLEDSPRTEGTAILSFAQIEDLTGKALPASARKFRSWWGNDSYHVQAVAWRAAGWLARIQGGPGAPGSDLHPGVTSRMTAVLLGALKVRGDGKV